MKYAWVSGSDAKSNLYPPSVCLCTIVAHTNTLSQFFITYTDMSVHMTTCGPLTSIFFVSDRGTQPCWCSRHFCVCFWLRPHVRSWWVHSDCERHQIAMCAGSPLVSCLRWRIRRQWPYQLKSCCSWIPWPSPIEKPQFWSYPPCPGSHSTTASVCQQEPREFCSPRACTEQNNPLKS